MMPALRAALQKLNRRLLGLIVRGVVALVDDGDPPAEEEEEDERLVQLLQLRLLKGETRDQIQRIQQYGFTSVPMPGAYPALVLCPAGERSAAIALAVDDLRHRPRGREPGEVSIYDHLGTRITLKAGVLEIVAVGNLTINVGGDATVTTSGQLNLGGGGGPGVARIGDAVEVAGVPGTITSGSTKVKAVG